MKKALIFAAMVGLLMACGTKNKQNNTVIPTGKSTETHIETSTEAPDGETSAIIEEVQPFFTTESFIIEESKPLRNADGGEESYEEVMTFKCDIDLPVTDNQTLYDSICRWVGESFGYEGDPHNLKAMIEQYKEQALTVFDDEFQEGFEEEYTIKVMEANDQYVTYQRDLFFEATSDPRASFDRQCVTFNRTTGQRFGYPMINKNEELESLVKKALLEQHFSEYSSEELRDVVYFEPFDDEEDGFSLPIRDPWILHNNVCFNYGLKEVADYCASTPECSLPYSVVEPFLTEEGIKYFRP